MQSTTWDGVFDSENTAERGKLMYRTTLKYDKYNRLALFGERVPGKDQARPVQKKDKHGNPVYQDGQPVYEKDLNDNIKYEPADDDGTDNITTKYEYDRDDRVTKITYDEKDEERSLQYTYDNLGRVMQVMVQNGGAVYEIDEDEKTDTDTVGYTGDVNTVSYQYADGGQGANSASTRVTSVVHSALNAPLNYAYDELGNITSESCDLDGNANQYRYDKLGQLIRASVRNDTTCGANGTTWVYTYDLGGNILKKEGYPKLTNIDNELPETPTKVIAYTYDTEWKDLLVSYDGKPIQYTPEELPTMPSGMNYFHIGNPYKYDGWTYEWQAGRQLKSMTHRNEQDVQDKKLEFAYDAAGLRTQKKYTYTDAQGHTAIETTDYILHGKLLMHQKTTTVVGEEQQGEPYQLHFYYDAAGRPIMVRVGNEEAESKYYSYVNNLQGDVLGIIDREQHLVVQYAYDPWGKALEARTLKTGCEKLAELNPFRYRGYVWDAETGLYYLRSRYYCPEQSRFINADSLLGKVGGLFEHNIFSYCKNKPIVACDHDGRSIGGAIAYGFSSETYRDRMARLQEEKRINDAMVAWARERTRAASLVTLYQSKGMSIKGVPLNLIPMRTKGMNDENFTVAGSYFNVKMDIYKGQSDVSYARLSNISWNIPDSGFEKIVIYCGSDVLKPDAQWATRTFTSSSGEWSDIGADLGWKPTILDISIIGGSAEVYIDGSVTTLKLGHDEIADLFGEMITH